MTTGAGVFNEIVIDQDKNLGAFMRTTDEAVSVLRTGASSGLGAGISRHGIGGFVRGAMPQGDYDILPQDIERLISHTEASRIAMEGNATALGLIGDVGDRQLQAITQMSTGGSGSIKTAIEVAANAIITGQEIPEIVLPVGEATEAPLERVINALSELSTIESTITGGEATKAVYEGAMSTIEAAMANRPDEGLADVYEDAMKTLEAASAGGESPQAAFESVIKSLQTHVPEVPEIVIPEVAVPEAAPEGDGGAFDIATSIAKNMMPPEVNLALRGATIAANALADTWNSFWDGEEKSPASSLLDDTPRSNPASITGGKYVVSPENAEKIGDQIAKLLEKAIVQAQKKLVEDGFMQAS